MPHTSLEGSAQTKFDGVIIRQEVQSSERSESVIKMPNHMRQLYLSKWKKWMRCPRFSVLCHPGRHNRCLNWRIQPQEVHDKLPLYSSQETWRCQNASERTCRTFRPTEIWKGMRKDAGIGELGRFVTGFGEREEVHGDGVLQLF